MRSDRARVRSVPAASRDPPDPLLPSLAAVAHPDVVSLRVAEVERPGARGDRDLRTSMMSTRCRRAGSSGELDKMLATASEPLYAAPGAAAPALVPDEQANDEAVLAIAPETGRESTYG